MDKTTYKVYLAGPIAGLTYDEATNWRGCVRQLLPDCIQCFSPMRGKDFLKREGTISPDAYEEEINSAHGIMGRDHYDVCTADAVLMNLLGAGRVSIGSVIEAAWCFAYRVPLILVMEPAGNVHEHVMLAEIPIYRVPTLLDGCSMVRQLLLP